VLNQSPRRGNALLVVFLVAIVGLFAMFAAKDSFASARTHDGATTVWFRDATIDHEVQGDLDIVLGNVSCTPDGVIDGDVHNYLGNFDADSCLVKGSVIDAFGSNGVDAFAAPFFSLNSDAFYEQNKHVLEKLAWDVVVLFAFLLFPLRVRVALDRVELHPGLSFASGTAALVASIPVAILLLISVIGIPLIPLEAAALFAGVWIGNAAVSLLIGRRLYELLRPHTTPSPLGALALGLIITTAAESLPFVGWAVSLLVLLVGLGAALLAFVKETSFRGFIGGPMNPQPSMPGAPPPVPGPPMNRPA
jgi:hypothetical protein